MKLRMLRMEWREEALAEGRAEGEESGMNKFAQLVQKLLADGRNDEIEAFATDENRRVELFKHYGIS